MSDPGFDPNAGSTGGSSGGSSGGSTSGGSSSSGSSSGSSSSGSSGPAPKTPAQQLAERRAQRAIAELRRSYLEMLRRWGLKPNKNLLNLVEKGVRGAWSSTQFLAMLRHTPEYKQKFRGIQWRTGMTEGQYLSTFAQFQARAKDIGMDLTRKDYAQLLRGGVSYEEYSERVDALQSIRQYAPMWSAFQQVLEERGIKTPGGELSKKELADFIMGRGSKQWEQAWQETFVTVNLEKVAGIGVIGSKEFSSGVGSYEITRGDLLQIIKSVESLSGGQLDLEKAGIDFAGLGERLRKYDKQYMARYGLTVKDAVVAELGGPGASELRAKFEKIVKEKEAFYEPRALPSFQRAQQKAQQGEDYVQSQ